MGKTIIAATDLYLTKDRTTAVLEGPDAAFLLRRGGGAVPAEFHGLVDDTGYPKGHVQVPTVAAKPKPKKKAAAKGRRKAPATKEVKPGGDK